MNCCVVQDDDRLRTRVWCAMRQHIEFNEILKLLPINRPLIDIAGNVSIHCQSGKDSVILPSWPWHFIPNGLSLFWPAMSPLRCPRIDASVTEQSGWIRTENSGGREYSEEFSLQAKETKSRSPNLNSSPNLTLHCPSNHVHDTNTRTVVVYATTVLYCLV